MGKVTIHKDAAPSEQLIKQAAQPVTVQDAKGRTIHMQKPGVLAQYRLVEAVGNEAAKNEMYMAMVMPLIYVFQIDDDPVVQPSTKLQVDALIQRLDEDGIAAVMAAIEEHFSKPTPEADKAVLKN